MRILHHPFLPSGTMAVSTDVWIQLQDKELLKGMAIEQFDPGVERLKVQAEEITRMLTAGRVDPPPDLIWP